MPDDNTYPHSYWYSDCNSDSASADNYANCNCNSDSTDANCNNNPDSHSDPYAGTGCSLSTVNDDRAY